MDETSLLEYFPDLEIDESSPFDKVASVVFPHSYAPVIVLENDRLVLTAKRYSLTPSWSKEEKVKWATYNARMNRDNSKTGSTEYIYEVPTWRGAFGRRHCLVPIQHFRESCHAGKADGHIVEFSPEDSDIIFAAGLWEDWIHPQTGEILSSYAIVTTEPDSFIQSVGHDRSPVFLTADTALGWLRPFKSAKAAYKYLEDSVMNPPLRYEKVRALKGHHQKELSLE